MRYAEQMNTSCDCGPAAEFEPSKHEIFVGRLTLAVQKIEKMHPSKGRDDLIREFERVIHSAMLAPSGKKGTTGGRT